MCSQRYDSATGYSKAHDAPQQVEFYFESGAGGGAPGPAAGAGGEAALPHSGGATTAGSSADTSRPHPSAASQRRRETVVSPKAGLFICPCKRFVALNMLLCSHFGRTRGQP